jgi:catechol 2,3-dioxygenase-like lactoylglutathione lyase family enzyme
MAKKKKKKKTAKKPSRRPGLTKDRRVNPIETLRVRAIEPSFTVADLARSVGFYTNAVGFVVDEEHKGPDGKLLGVMMKAGTCRLGLTQDDWAKGRDRVKGVGVRVWCTTVQDIDGIAARIKGAGQTLSEEPTDQPWGGRTVAFDDPDGFHVTIYRR